MCEMIQSLHYEVTWGEWHSNHDVVQVLFLLLTEPPSLLPIPTLWYSKHCFTSGMQLWWNHSIMAVTHTFWLRSQSTGRLFVFLLLVMCGFFTLPCAWLYHMPCSVATSYHWESILPYVVFWCLLWIFMSSGSTGCLFPEVPSFIKIEIAWNSGLLF